MIACLVCHEESSRTELVDEVLKINGRHVLVEGVPATVCQRCGERTFSRETVERMRMMVADGGSPAKTVPLDVYAYALDAGQESAGATSIETA